MAYLCKDETTRKKIKEYINEYVTINMMSPSIRDIAEGTGISRSMVQRYMAAMREDGEIDYGRRNISTEFTSRIDRDCVVVTRIGDSDGEYFSLPRSWVGDGSFYMIEAADDSMSGIGISEGDTVIIRKDDSFLDGDCVAFCGRDGELILRNAYERINGILLSAANPKYSSKTERNVEIVGVAVKVIKSLGKTDDKEDKGRSSLQVFLL